MKYSESRRRKIITTILFLAPAVSLAGPTAPTPLKEAVAAFNDKAAAHLSATEPRGDSSVRPAPLTEDEVIAAIGGWNREKQKIDDTTYRTFREIADARVLPPGATLRFSSFWHQDAEQDEYEFLVWWIDLDVMTGENTGYTFRIRDATLDRRPALMPSPGYSWAVDPYVAVPVQSVLDSGWSAGGIVFSISEDREGALTIIAAWLLRDDMHGLRVIAFDEERNRYVLAERSIGLHENLLMKRFRLDPGKLPARRVQHLGFEALDNQAMRHLSEAMLRRAREKGIEVLPLPQVGSPYEFTLTTVNGVVIDSRRLRGKVVLIDCWASWCGPCMKKMPELKEIYSKWHARGLEVVGLSFDTSGEAAKAAFASYEIPWPLVVVPSGEEIRQLWTETARITTLPRVLLVDQQGVLRLDQSPPNRLEEEISALLRDSPVVTDGPAKP